MITTREQAIDQIRKDIEASGAEHAEFNIAAIADRLRERIGHWNFDVLDEGEFWLIVEANAIRNPGLGEYPAASFLDRAAFERLTGLVSFFESDGVARETAIASLKRVVASL